jgi:hypothetical protein
MAEANPPPDDEAAAAAVELAPLPREQVGPFLILGVPKDADTETIEAHWAQRVIWARRGQTRVPLEDIHWAREVLRDPERRLKADLDSLNPDTAAGDLGRIARRYSLDGPTWQPLDPEPPPPAFPGEVPDPAAEAAKLPTPEVPVEFPGMAHWLAKFAAAIPDPWGLLLPAPKPPQDHP